MKHRWQAVFDFVRKAGEEQRKAFEALREGKAMEYVRDKVARDLEQVKKFNDGLANTREKLSRDLGNVLRGDIADLDEIMEELEEVLIMSDLGVDTVDKILDGLRSYARKEGLQSAEDVKQGLKQSLVTILTRHAHDVSLSFSQTPPTIIMVIGANGMGKTTTIGKLATRFRQQGATVLVAACDTFRAAAVDQLDEWVKRAEVDIFKPAEKDKSPSSVLFKALDHAIKEQYDYLVVDTSGRLHTNLNLMEELKKMFRVVRKFREDGADEVILVVDATIGRNAVTQAKTWNDEVGVTGLAVTKLDGTARAGFVVSVVDELDIPVKLIGVGEGVDDLRDFDPELFVDGLVG